jgi:large subunit ribosomal protein L25
MEIATVQGETRQLGGHHSNDRLRRRGFVPAVIYGHGEPVAYASVSLHDLRLALDHRAHVVKVVADGNEEQYLLKGVQYDHLQQTPVHVDLMRVDLTEKVSVKVAIEYRGTPKGCADGGVLVTVLSDLDIECELINIPESIRIHVEHLELNQVLHVRDVQFPPGIVTKHAADDIVAVVQPPRVQAEAVPGAVVAGVESAEPEVIGKGPKEAEEGEGGE